MKQVKPLAGRLMVAVGLMGLASCTALSPERDRTSNPDTPTSATPDNSSQARTPTKAVDSSDRSCTLVENGYGSQGQVAVQAEEVVTGLEVPWGILFLSGGDMLVTERAGRIRLVRNGQLQSQPVATVPVTERGEGGLLGITPHPNFAENRLFYLYYTADRNGSPVNRVERWQLSPDGQNARWTERLTRHNHSG